MKPTLAASGMFIQARPACMARELMLCLSILILLGLVCGCTPLQSNNSRTTFTTNGLPILIDIKQPITIAQPVEGTLTVVKFHGDANDQAKILQLDVTDIGETIARDGFQTALSTDGSNYHEQIELRPGESYPKRVQFRVTLLDPNVCDDPDYCDYEIRSRVTSPNDNGATVSKKKIAVFRYEKPDQEP